MMRTHFTQMLTIGALSCAVFGSSLQIASAKPMTQRAPILRDRVVRDRVLNGGRTLPQLSLGAPIPLMTEMINYARVGRVGNNSKAAVYATVVITSSSSQVRPGRSSVTYLHGVLTLTGSKGQERFSGDLTKFSNIGIANPNAPFVVSNSAGTSNRITIFPNGSVSITSKFRGLKGIESYSTSFKSDGADGLLWGRDSSGASTRLVSVALAKSVFPLSGASQPAPPPAPAPAPAPAPPPPPAGPRGARVRVGGEIRVTNSADGVADGTVEMFGNLTFNGHEMWKIRRSSAQDGKAGKTNTLFLFDPITCNVIFDDPSTWTLKVWGFLADRDMGTSSDSRIQGDDTMWNPSNRGNYQTHTIDLKKMVEQGSTQVILYGDRDSENADVVINVRKFADIN